MAPEVFVPIFHSVESVLSASDHDGGVVDWGGPQYLATAYFYVFSWATTGGGTPTLRLELQDSFDLETWRKASDQISFTAAAQTYAGRMTVGRYTRVHATWTTAPSTATVRAIFHCRAGARLIAGV